MRSKSPYPHKVPTTIAFDPVVLAAIKDLSRESDRSLSSLVNSLAANHLLLLGRIAFELDDDHEEPETNIRFSDEQGHSLGRSEFVRGAENYGQVPLPMGGDFAKTPGPDGGTKRRQGRVVRL